MQKLPDDVTLRHLARVVESSDDAIVSKTLDGIITSWNRAAERMFGYSAAEAIGQSIRMIIPADRQAEEDMVLARIRSGEAVTHFETVRQRKDGTQFPISLTVSPIHDETGRIVRASKIARDITEKTDAASASRRLAAVVESSDDAIITKDLNSIITSWNPGAERIFGYTEAEAIGRSIRMLIPEELQAEEDDVLEKIRAGGKIDHFETIRQRKDGTRRTISLTVSPLRNEKGEVVGASKVARDVTERARLLAASQEHTRNTEKLREVGGVVASTLDREASSESHRHRDRADERGVWSLLLQRYRRRVRRFVPYSIRCRARAGRVREAPTPRATAVFAPTFRDEGPVRLDDVTTDPRYGRTRSFPECRRDTCPCEATWRCRSRACPEPCLADCSSATRKPASSRHSTSGSRWVWRHGRRWPSRTPGSTRTRRPQTG